MKNFVFLFLLLAFSQISFAQEPTDTIIVEDVEDIDLDDIEDDEIAEASSFPWERFAVGGQIGNLQFGDVTALGVAPEATYKVNDMFTVGVGGLIDYTKYNRLFDRFGRVVDSDYEAFNVGPRFFTRVSPVETFPIFLQLEYERLSQETPWASEIVGNELVVYDVDQTVNNYVVGAGFNNGPGYIALLYNFSNSGNRDDFRDEAVEDGANPGIDWNRFYPYNGLNFRAGLLIPLGSNKNRRRQ